MKNIDPAIIAAIILAVTNGITAILGRRRAKKLEDRIAEADKAIPAIPSLIEDQCGFKARKSKHIIRVDLDGTYHVEVIREGVKATTQNILHFVHQIATSQGKISDPQLTDQKSPKALDPVIHKPSRTDTACRFFINIAGGGLSEKDGEISYSYAYSISKGFCMTKEEADQAYKDDPFKYEYCAMAVTNPTELIELEVRFANGYAIRPYLAAFVGYTEFINDKELKKRSDEGCLTRIDDIGARFRIKQSLIGFRYAIYWTPMLKKDYEKLFNKT